jgi:3-phosphoglycerate kinase
MEQKAIVMVIAEHDTFSIAGGDDTLAAVDKRQISDKISSIFNDD